MFNVLPDTSKIEIKKEYKLRFWIMALIVLIVVQFSSLFFIFPAIEASTYKRDDMRASIETLRKARAEKESETAFQIIPRANTALEILRTTVAYPRVLPAVRLVLSKQTDTLRLVEFLYNSNSDSKDASQSTLIVKGVSANREALVSFVKNLKDSGFFTSVDLPVSNLAKEKNIDFSISASITRK